MNIIFLNLESFIRPVEVVKSLTSSRNGQTKMLKRKKRGEVKNGKVILPSDLQLNKIVTGHIQIFKWLYPSYFLPVSILYLGRIW